MAWLRVKGTFVYTIINSHPHVSGKSPLVLVMRFPKTNHFHNNIYIKMLYSITLVITCKISNNFLSNDTTNDCTADSKDQESIQLSITSES